MLLLNENSIHPYYIITMSLVHAYQKTVSKQYILDYLDLFLGTLSPIEQLSDELERRMKKHQPKNEKQLRELLQLEWNNIGEDVIKKIGWISSQSLVWMFSYERISNKILR